MCFTETLLNLLCLLGLGRPNLRLPPLLPGRKKTDDRHDDGTVFDIKVLWLLRCYVDGLAPLVINKPTNPSIGLSFKLKTSRMSFNPKTLIDNTYVN